jgi:NADH dehydrogenase
MKASKVFVTGGTGFVGRAVIHALQAHNYLIRCLVRPGSESRLKGLEAIERVSGDVTDPESLSSAMEGCKVVIHLVGIIWEIRTRHATFDRLHAQATSHVVAAAKAAGINRYIQMSALNVRPGARSRYHQTKWQAEETVRSSGLQWTIFRPSIIYGPGDEFISKLAKMVRRLPAMPVLGDGQYRLQPIPVEQVAEGFARAIDRHESINQTYEVGGPRSHTMNEILDLIGECFGRSSVRKLHVPLGIVRPLVRLLEPLSLVPVTSDQLMMLEEENVCDPTRFFHDFELKPVELSEGLHRMMHIGNA